MNYFRKFSSRTQQKARRVAMREADTARDNGDAAQAAKLYGTVIECWGPTFGLLVQRGNALKDSKAFKLAEDVYQAALLIKPNDADCLLQLGHLMKLSGDLTRAAHFYREAYRFDPTSHNIGAELRALEEQQALTPLPASAKALQPSPRPSVVAVDRGSRPLVIHQRIMNELARRRN